MYTNFELPQDLKIKSITVMNLKHTLAGALHDNWVEIHYYYPSTKVYSVHVLPVKYYETDCAAIGFDKYHEYTRKVVFQLAPDESETINQ